MKRKIVHIDSERCTGCGLCAKACHEGAIAMEDGKAVLVKDDYCDGLGDCLPACPADAISIQEREAAPYDEAAVKARLAAQGKRLPARESSAGHGCPGSKPQTLKPLSPAGGQPAAASPAMPAAFLPGLAGQLGQTGQGQPSCLAQWPVQLRLAPVKAPFYEGARLLVAADCSAYAYPGFHQDFMKGRVTLIGCPKLDPVDYSEKLAEIVKANGIRSILVARMQVPCCQGLANAVQRALQSCGRCLPWSVAVIDAQGRIVDF